MLRTVCLSGHAGQTSQNVFHPTYGGKVADGNIVKCCVRGVTCLTFTSGMLVPPFPVGRAKSRLPRPSESAFLCPCFSLRKAVISLGTIASGRLVAPRGGISHSHHHMYLCILSSVGDQRHIRNPLIPAHNVLRAVSRAADRDAKHRQFLLRMQVRCGVGSDGMRQDEFGWEIDQSVWCSRHVCNGRSICSRDRRRCLGLMNPQLESRSISHEAVVQLLPQEMLPPHPPSPLRSTYVALPLFSVRR